MTKSEHRKLLSERFLERSGITVDTSLPVFVDEDSARIKSREEIARRAAAAFLTAQIAIDICLNKDLRKAVAVFGYHVDKLGVRGDLTPCEQRYFDLEHCSGITYEEAFEMQWRVERCMPLFWVLGMTDGDLDFPSQITNTDTIAKTLCDASDLSVIIGISENPSDEDILSNADTAMRMHHTCVRARELGDLDLKNNLDSDVVSEQYLGFCWLVGVCESDDWDNPKPIF